MTNKKTLIIGGVAGGASCAARLRRLDEKREIILFERGAYISFANCGLPYYVGDVIQNRESLFLMTPERMAERFRIDARINSEVLSIDRKTKTVTIRNLHTGTQYAESYDDLVIATGSSPLRPNIPGIDSEGIRTLWTIPDADEIRNLIRVRKIETVAVVGGGFIGLEMADNLWKAGIKVTIIEAADQVMPPLDYEMALLLHENIKSNGVAMYLSDGVASFDDNGSYVKISLKSGKEIRADLVILAIGVRPNSQLAKEAGLLLNERGGIIVNEHMRTIDPSIYAVGDVVDVKDFVGGGRTMIPLAGPANKQGRIAADNLAGIRTAYEGTQGSAVAQVFDLTVASTGTNEKTLIQRGYKKGKDYESVIITQNSHAGYYPGAMPMTIKLIFAPDTEKIFGAQIVGGDGVDKRIDTIGVALRLGAEVTALKNLELAYAPPYSSAKDPVNMAGFAAENVINGFVSFAAWNEPDENKSAILLDVREAAETVAYPIPKAIHIPLGSLREKLHTLDKEKEYIIFCAIGVRAYSAARIMMQNGFKSVRVYPGGARFYASTHGDHNSEETKNRDPENDRQQGEMSVEDKKIKLRVDCSGLQCPGPIMEVFRSMEKLQASEMLEVVSSDPGFGRDIVAWCHRTGNVLVSRITEKGKTTATIRKAGEGKERVQETGRSGPKGKTIIVFDGDMDKALAAFVVANGALAMGRPVTMFFTFWGLTLLRKPEKSTATKSFIEKMFGIMLPRGAEKVRLSRMNMGGMGTALMKRVMKSKKIESLQQMMEKAIKNGAKLIACSMSMEVMGITRDELIDGIEIGGVGSYLDAAEEADVNLFV